MLGGSSITIKKIWPVFADPELEANFLADSKEKNILAVAKAMFGISLFFAFFIFSDLLTPFSTDNLFYTSISFKLAIVVIGWGFFQYLAKRPDEKTMTVSLLLYAVVFLACLIGNCDAYIRGVTPKPNMLEMSIPFSFVTMLLYIYAPVGIRLQLALATMTLLSYGFVTYWHFAIGESRFAFGLSYILLSNSFGLTLSYYINHNLRLNWARDKQRQDDLNSLQREVSRRTVLENELKKQAMTDPLTAADNRRSFVKSLERELSISERHQTPLCLVTFDVDHFKSINDKFGHDVGDEVLIALAAHVPKQLRRTDIFARIGGEEFAIILPRANLQQARKIAENACDSIRNLKIQNKSEELTLTASFGVVERISGESSQFLLKRVDICMYRAKEQGRDRVEVG